MSRDTFLACLPQWPELELDNNQPLQQNTHNSGHDCASSQLAVSATLSRALRCPLSPHFEPELIQHVEDEDEDEDNDLDGDKDPNPEGAAVVDDMGAQPEISGGWGEARANSAMGLTCFTSESATQAKSATL